MAKKKISTKPETRRGARDNKSKTANPSKGKPGGGTDRGRATELTAQPAGRLKAEPAARPGDEEHSHPVGAVQDTAAAHEADLDEQDAKLTVVAIGASAGGLEAIMSVFHDLSADTGAAFVIIQHLSPDHPSALPELLGGKTQMPVRTAENGMELEPDNVYVIPPNRLMSLDGSKLALVQRTPKTAIFVPISHFFLGLAKEPAVRPIAVVLSGSASDGSDALQAVKAAGGITIAQSPDSAKFDAMPRAAIATGFVDLVLDPAAIAMEINRIAGHAYVRTRMEGSADGLNITLQQYQTIFQVLREESGVDFSQYKQPTIRRRLQRRMLVHKIDSVDQYIKLLRDNPDEAANLYNDLLIQVTSFFREPKAFDILRSRIFPDLLEHRTNDQPIRVWAPGCSTGEEAYSIAIELMDFLGNRRNAGVQVFATDVSEAAIERARAGVYPACVVDDVPPDRLRKHFSKMDGRYRVSRAIRDACIFARQDLTRDPPFSRLDLVVCRNVMIYLSPAFQRRLLSVFHYALKPAGYLLLGSSETVGPAQELFEPVEKSARIYRKRAVETYHHLTFPHHPTGVLNAGNKGLGHEPRAVPALQAEVTRLVLDRYAPPGVIVDEEMQIVQFRGRTGMFLEAAPDDANLSLFKMTREGLAPGLRSAIHKAKKNKERARAEGLHVKRNGGALQRVAVEVHPLSVSGSNYYLIAFEAQSEPAGPIRQKKEKPPKKRGKKRAEADLDAEAIERMQQELNASRDYLQSIIQDLEAANEELQSANEEILSSNEELQSTNEELDTAREELQSTNEELNTVNDELNSRNDELSRANSDLVNFLGSVQIAIVMISQDLRIRRFTPMAEKILNLIPADVGRPIAHIKPNIDCPQLEELITGVIDDVTATECEVRDWQGHWWSLRIRPYKDIENRIDGAVLALFDIDAAKKHQADVNAALLVAEEVVETAEQPLAVLERDLRIRTVNRAFCDIFGADQEDAAGRPVEEIVTHYDGLYMRHWLERLLEADTESDEMELGASRQGDGDRRLRLLARKLLSGDGGRVSLAIGNAGDDSA